MERVTRHKSCAACIQKKRRCDRTQPRCQRCTTTGTDCQYIGRNRVRQQQIIEQSVVVANLDRPFPPSYLEHINPAALFSPCLDEHSFSFLQPPFNPQFSSQSLIPSVDDLAAPQQPHFIDIDAKLYARVQYCASRLSMLPRLFATTGQTMFIHRQTSQSLLSPVLQQAMSACALHSMKTPDTTPLVHQLLQQNVQTLLTTTNSATATSPDLLTALQALLLYQLMRLFDGDIRLRASAEADEAVTVLWASELRTRVCSRSLAVDLISTFSGDPKDWQVWLFSESIRRTVVTTFLLRGMYNYLKTGTDSPTVVGVFFSAQRGLWEAQSEACWARARGEKLELQVLVNEWDDVMALAGPDDLEELGVLIMSIFWGLKSTRDWLGHERSEEYGLDGRPAGHNTPGRNAKAPLNGPRPGCALRFDSD